MDAVDETMERSGAATSLGIQPGGYLLELSPDWIVRRASENIHHLLGESHVTLIDEPLGRFVHGQALHDLRNLFSRLSGTTGIGRAYAIRLTDDPELVDIAFQLTGGRVLLEAVPSAAVFGEHFGTVAGLIAGLSGAHGQPLLDGAARRMRALTGYDRIVLRWGAERAESSRGLFPGQAENAVHLPRIVGDAEAPPVPVFPRQSTSRAIESALMASCDADAKNSLGRSGVRASLCLPFSFGGKNGSFRCESRVPRAPNFELHAAAELFAQMFALRLEIDRLNG
jgi:light-regulated signal transduction histidine kinase (bacteriophytochrome)